MTFAMPLRLLWLALLPLLWWLSQPPAPRRVALTPHLAQWRAALVALRRRLPRGSPWRFVLLAIAYTAVVAAAAGPQLPGRPGPRRLVVLFDASASTAARSTAGDTVHDHLRARLAEGLAVVPPGVALTVLRCGGPLRRRHGESARELHDLGPPAGALEIDLEALSAAVAAADTAVWTLTDGQGQTALPQQGALTVIDGRGPNAALLAVRIADGWPLPQLELELEVIACADPDEDGTVAVSVSAGGAVAAVTRELDLGPGLRTAVPLAVARDPAGGWLELEVTVAGDVLPDDGRAQVWLPPLPAPRIAWLADDEAGPFARIAAAALAAEVGGTVVAPDQGGGVGLLLVDGGQVQIAAGAVRALTFGSVLRPAAVAAEPWPQPDIADWDRGHALTAGLDLSELRVAQAWRGLLPDGEPFLWADDHGARVPLAVVARGAVGSVHFGFRLGDSNLPLLAAFPQLLRRAFVFCYGAAAAVAAPPPAPDGEQDLRKAAQAADRPLPRFGTTPLPLGRWFVLAAALVVALRAFVR